MNPGQPAPHNKLLAWLQAVRPSGVGMVLPPALFGHAVATGPHADPRSYALTIAFALLAQAVAVFTNDLGDVATDRDNEDYNAFSGGSRVVPDGLLQEQELRYGALVASLGLLAVAGWGYAITGSVALPLLAFGCITISIAYSLPPLRLNYVGLGPLLQALGTGVILPLAGAASRAGELSWPFVAPVFLAAAAANLWTSLPDIASDARGGKKTLAVRLGLESASVVAMVLTVLAWCGLSLVLLAASPRRAVAIGILAVTGAPLVIAIAMSIAERARRSDALFLGFALAAPTLAMLGSPFLGWFVSA